MEPLKAMYPVCTLIKSDGTRCGSPALTGTNFCFQHIGGKIPTAKSTPQTRSTPLNFIYPSSHEAIQHNLFLVVQALSEGKIDNATASTYNRLFRSAQLNLQRWQAAKSKLNHDEVEQQMIPCAEPATNAGAPHPEKTCDNFPPSSSSGVGAPHLAVFEMWEDAEPGSPPRATFACWGGKRKSQTPETSDHRSAVGDQEDTDPSIPSVLPVAKNENESQGELNAEPATEPRSLNPDQPGKFKPNLTWGEEPDLKPAEMKKLREQEEARARGENMPVVSPERRQSSHGVSLQRERDTSAHHDDQLAIHTRSRTAAMGHPLQHATVSEADSQERQHPGLADGRHNYLAPAKPQRN